MLKIIGSIIQLPLLPVKILFAAYIIYKIFKENGVVEVTLAQEMGQDIIPQGIKTLIRQLSPLFYVVSIYLWYLILK